MLNIKRTLSKLALSPNKKLGQNFLQQPLVAKSIIDSFHLNNTDHILEIGPGLGALTNFLRSTKQVIAVEKSMKLFDFLQKHFTNNKNVIFYHCDIFEFNFQLLKPNIKYKVVSNLPYSLATKILRWLLPQNDLFDYLYFSFPEEIANKIIAKPKTKANSALSIYANLFSLVQQKIVLNASAFYPQPKVKTTFLAFQLRSEKFFQSKEKEQQFLQFVNRCFFYKRKTLINNLRSGYNLNTEKLNFLTKFLLDRFDSKVVRAEDLSLENFLILFDTFLSISSL